MKAQFYNLEDLKINFPNEWILLGNPLIENTKVKGGILIYHSIDKKEVCYIGRDKTEDYKTVTIAYAGELIKSRKIGILRKI